MKQLNTVSGGAYAIDECIGCGVCEDTCPKGAITLEGDMPFVRAVIDHSKCNNCNVCVEGCPFGYMLS